MNTEPQIINYLEKQRVGVLAVEMPDGSPHAATVHFANFYKGRLEFIFLTEKTYRKVEPLLKKESTRASFVIGTNENDMKTFQMDGIIKIADEQNTKDIYFAKFPDKKEKFSGPNDIFLVFTPTWWRFTDWTTPEGKKIWTSQ